MAQYATGEAIMIEMITSFTKSFDSIAVIPLTLAPSTLRMPISLLRCSAMNADKANKPRQAIMIANTAKLVNILPVRCTSAYMLAKLSSKNVYRIGWLGENFFHTDVM